jgi:hypothetical protein
MTADELKVEIVEPPKRYRPTPPIQQDDLYARLREILDASQAQASQGKGKERHAVAGENFENQQICEITRRLSGHPAAGALFQSVKKIYESGRLPKERAIAELYGAINYIAAAIIVMEDA